MHKTYLCLLLGLAIVLAAGMISPLEAQACEDCYECTIGHIFPIRTADCCSGSRCDTFTEGDNADDCTQMKSNIDDCYTVTTQHGPKCFGSSTCGGGLGPGGGGGDGGNDECVTSGYCPPSCTSCTPLF